MDNAGYVTITRQQGLLQELRVIANNIANMSTTGYRREATMFDEYIKRLPVEGGSLSMAAMEVPDTRLDQGALGATGGSFDLAIEGRGFFQVETPNGIRLTRDGAFLRNADGEMVTPEGHRVLDPGGGPIFLPPSAKNIAISTDGTVSADGVTIGAVGIVEPENPLLLRREGGVLFAPEGGVQQVFDAVIHQGFLEESNVSPISELGRMIEVQRAYEAANSLQEREDERIRSAIRTIGQLR